MLREYHSGSPPGRRCSLENCQGEDRAAPSLVVRTNSQPDGRVDVRRYGSEAASVPISSPATVTVHPPRDSAINSNRRAITIRTRPTSSGALRISAYVAMGRARGPRRRAGSCLWTVSRDWTWTCAWPPVWSRACRRLRIDGPSVVLGAASGCGWRDGSGHPRVATFGHAHIRACQCREL
jgi:hypothetical protein